MDWEFSEILPLNPTLGKHPGYWSYCALPEVLRAGILSQ